LNVLKPFLLIAGYTVIWMSARAGGHQPARATTQPQWFLHMNPAASQQRSDTIVKMAGTPRYSGIAKVESGLSVGTGPTPDNTFERLDNVIPLRDGSILVAPFTASVPFGSSALMDDTFETSAGQGREQENTREHRGQRNCPTGAFSSAMPRESRYSEKNRSGRSCCGFLDSGAEVLP